MCACEGREVIKHLFPSHPDPTLQACMLLNNLQALRVNVQSLFEELGGAEVSINSSLGS